MLLFLLACDFQSSSDFECDRAYGAPMDRGYIGEPGADRCDAGEACASEPGEAGGTCVTNGQCVLDGVGAGVGVSKDCATDEVCTVPDGAWYGTCGTALASGEVSGSVYCEEPSADPFTVAAGEIYSFVVDFGPTDAVGGVNVYSWFSDQDGDLVYAGNPVGTSGVAGTEGASLPFSHAFQEGGELEWNFEVFQCSDVAYSGTWERHSGAVTHIDLEHAMPLAQGETASATIGCFDADGAGNPIHLQHAYALEAAAGDTLNLSLSAEDFWTGEEGGWLGATLYDATGAPVIESGNPLTVDASGGRSWTAATGGAYYLLVDIDWSACSPTTYHLSY